MSDESAAVPLARFPDVNQDLVQGKLLAESGFFPDVRAAVQAAVKVQAGRELGFGPVASMTGIHIIKGRITLSANLIAAAIKRSGRYDYRVRTHTHQICEIEFFQKGESVGVVTFTMDDAKRAGLAGNENWKKYPANMLFARALSNGAKFHCPDVFGGPVYTPDEIEPRSRIDPETGDMLCPTPPPAPEVKLLPPDRGPEGTSLGEDAHARVSALVEETGTDLSRFLAHYRVTSIQDLTLEQCSEAIDVLIARKDSNPTSVS